jgi:predicted transcriptional regulator
MIAALVAQLFMGKASVSPYQMAARVGHLERRFALPVTAVLRSDVSSVPPDTTLDEFFEQHLLGNREKAVAVVDDHRYLGIMRIEELRGVPQDEWASSLVVDHMRADFPTVRTVDEVRTAINAMEAADTDLLAVVDGQTFVGVVTTTEILKLDEILDRTTEAGETSQD